MSKRLLCWAHLISGELIIGGTCYWKEFYVSKWVGLDNKNSFETRSLKQSMGLYSGGLIIGRIFAPEIWGGFYIREGLFFLAGLGAGLIIGILR